MTVTLIAKTGSDYTMLRSEKRKLGLHKKARICNKNGIIPKQGRPRKK